MTPEQFQHSSTLFQTYVESKRAFYAELREHDRQFFDECIRQLFKRFDGLNAVAILGWTPGFNDGEPCTHSSHVFAGVVNSYGMDFDDYGEVSDFAMDHTPDGAQGPNDSLSAHDRTKVAEELLVLDEVLEFLWETNYRMTAYRDEDGLVVIEIDHYDCGY